MFNKTTIVRPVVGPGRTEYVPFEKSVTVHEHRAPTDASIAIYRELEEKAWDSVISKLVEEIPSIQAQYLVVERNPADRNLYVAFKINGRLIKLKVSSHDHLIGKSEVIQAVAEEIVNQLSSALVRAV